MVVVDIVCEETLFMMEHEKWKAKFYLCFGHVFCGSFSFSPFKFLFVFYVFHFVCVFCFLVLLDKLRNISIKEFDARYLAFSV